MRVEVVGELATLAIGLGALVLAGGAGVAALLWLWPRSR